MRHKPLPQKGGAAPKVARAQQKRCSGFALHTLLDSKGVTEHSQLCAEKTRPDAGRNITALNPRTITRAGGA